MNFDSWWILIRLVQNSAHHSNSTNTLIYASICTYASSKSEGHEFYLHTTANDYRGGFPYPP